MTYNAFRFVSALLLVPATAFAQWTTGSGGTIYYTGGNVGIGTSAPASTLHIVGPQFRWDSSNTGTDAGLLFLTWSSSFAGIAAGQTANYTNAKNLVLQLFGGNVGIGTTNPQYKLAVNGNIGAQDIIVTNTGWSDYVFLPGYRLRPLSELNTYIQANHHLPDIPTAAEIKEKGVSLADMQAKLLAKVEELTLHMIQADERNDRLERQNRELRDRIARLEKAAAVDSTPGAAK